MKKAAKKVAKKTVKKATKKVAKKTVKKTTKKVAPKVGRPTNYTQELADEICAYIAEGYTLRRLCAMEGMPGIRTFFTWLRVHEEFAQQYARAKEESCDALFEEMLAIAEETPDVVSKTHFKKCNAAVQAQRLRVDAIKWQLSKIKPKKYSEKQQHEVSGKDGGPIQLEGNNITFNTYKKKDATKSTSK